MADLHAPLQCLEVTAGAAAAYLQNSAAQFASELWSFVASGLSIQAHDRLVFGAQEGTNRPSSGRQHSAGVPMKAEGIGIVFAFVDGKSERPGAELRQHV